MKLAQFVFALWLAVSASVAGNWDMSIQASDHASEATMVLKLDGDKVTGSLTHEHLGNVAIDGKLVDGVLSFSVEHDSSRIEFRGTMKEDGTLAGNISGPMGEMKWTAKRAK